MGFTCGIVGLPNVGKSTLFNALTAAHADASNYPFCTIDPNIGIVPVPDQRLHRLGEIYRPPKVTPTTLEFVDIAGLVRGASKGEGLGNQFLSHIREVDAVIHIVRCFDDPNVVHVDGSVDPERDIGVVETELILKDLETVERKIAETRTKAKSGEKKLQAEADSYERLRQHLLSGRLAHYYSAPTDEEARWLRSLHLLTIKPVIYVCNVKESELGMESPYVQKVRAAASREDAKVAVISAEVEAELAELPAAEREPFLRDLGLKEPGLHQVIREGYDLLHLITFFTANPKELHAWTVSAGTTASVAAGKVHTDFEAGFIRAEVMSFEDLDRLGSEHAVREHGLMRVEGRDYLVRDGEVLFFRFNV